VTLTDFSHVVSWYQFPPRVYFDIRIDLVHEFGGAQLVEPDKLCSHQQPTDQSTATVQRNGVQRRPSTKRENERQRERKREKERKRMKRDAIFL